MEFQVFQLFSAIVTGKMYAVPAGFGGQCAIYRKQIVHIQKGNALLGGGLSNQLVV